MTDRKTAAVMATETTAALHIGVSVGVGIIVDGRGPGWLIRL